MENTTHEFLENLITSLVDNPEGVVVERRVDEMGVLYTVAVAQDDMGKIIGRHGNTATAIRTLLRVVGQKAGERANMKIQEPEGREEKQVPVEEAAPVASQDEVDAAIEGLKNDF